MILLIQSFFLTMPTLAALRTREPIFQPVYTTWAIWLCSIVSWVGIINMASCSLGSNFSPVGFISTTSKLANTLSIVFVVISYPFAIFFNCSFTASISSISSILSKLVCSRANYKLSRTSNSSFANLLIANYLASSICFLYLLMVLSFSATWYTYFCYKSFKAFNYSSIFFSWPSIVSSYSLIRA